MVYNEGLKAHPDAGVPGWVDLMNISKELIIVLVVALLIFGPSRLAGLGAALGKTIRDFRKSMEDPDENKLAPPSTPQSTQGQSKQ